MSSSLYDDFTDYDRFVNWERRLAFELPFIEQQLARVQARHVLDTACGTGQHAIALARQGISVLGVDLSEGMIERARVNAAAQGVDSAEFLVAGFGEVAARTERRFDAVLCLGNSLPHVLTDEMLHATIEDMADVLLPGGLLLLQNRNMEAVVAERSRWMPLQSHSEAGHEWLFVRFYDFEANGTLTFNVVSLHKDPSDTWTERLRQATLRPWTQREILEAIRAAGLDSVACYGTMAGAPFVQSSPNLIVAARKPTQTNQSAST